MYNYLLNLVSSLSISIAAIIAIIRFKKIPQNFYPFIYLLWIGLFCEVISWVIVRVYMNNLFVGNIYVLVESLILLWQFKKWASYRQKTGKYAVIGWIFIGVWIVDNLILHRITMLNSAFRVFSSLVLVLLSIEQINHVLVSERKNILRNAKFLLNGAFVIFFTYKALFEVFYMLRIQMSNNFYHNLFLILTLVNLFTNLVYALAIIWIPKKQKFTLPF